MSERERERLVLHKHKNKKKTNIEYAARVANVEYAARVAVGLERERARETSITQVNTKTKTTQATVQKSARYSVVKTHRMPYLYRSFPAKELLIIDLTLHSLLSLLLSDVVEN